MHAEGKGLPSCQSQLTQRVADLKLSSEKFPMKIKPLRLIGLAVALLVVNSVALHAAEASKEDAGMVSKLIGALEKSDYEAFVADGEMPSNR
jgi:hypothetical protein